VVEIARTMSSLLPHHGEFLEFFKQLRARPDRDVVVGNARFKTLDETLFTLGEQDCNFLRVLIAQTYGPTSIVVGEPSFTETSKMLVLDFDSLSDLGIFQLNSSLDLLGYNKDSRSTSSSSLLY